MSRVLGSPDYNLGASEELTTENPGPKVIIQVAGCSPQYSGSMLVTLSATEETFAAAVPGLQASVLADLAFGVNAATRVEVDVRVGTQLVLPASQVTVRAALLNGNLPESPISVRVYANIAAANASPPRALNTRSYRSENLSTGTSRFYLVPPFAYSVMLISSAALSPGAVTVRFNGANQSTGYSSGQDLLVVDGAALQASMADDGYKLTQAVRSIQITNNSGATIALAPSFGLVL
jgi:hypothetical protein